MPDDFEEALNRVADALDRESIAWAVTGSFALAYHGIVRATNDIDFKVVLGPRDVTLPRIRDALAPVFRSLDETTFRFRERVDVELYPLDGEIDREAIERRERASLFPSSDREYWIVTAEDLLLSKLREFVRWEDLKHVDDLRKLAVAKRASLDWEYLETRFDKHPGFREAWDRWIERRA